jgi:DinB superfamily
VNRLSLQNAAVVAGGADPGQRATASYSNTHLNAIGYNKTASPRPATTSPLQDAVTEVLRQGESLLNSLNDEEYTRKLPTVFGSTIGGHYRHCLDHFQTLLQGLDTDEINYDHRERNPRIENDRTFALAETERILRGFESISTRFLDCPINVRSKVNYELDAAPLIGSTVGRELMYAVAHAIHHYALIAVMCGMLEVPIPAGFGVAPSTLKYHAKQPKAA